MAKAEEPVRMVSLAETSASWDGTPLPPYPDGTPQVTILRGVVRPGAKLAQHKHPVINAGIVLRGELTVVAEDGTTRCFRAGEAIVEMVGKYHYGENRGSEEVELVLFYAGTAELPLSEKR